MWSPTAIVTLGSVDGADVDEQRSTHDRRANGRMLGLLLIGIGMGSSFPAIMTLAMSGATPEDSGLASGLVNTSVQVGGAIGLAILATLSSQRTQSLIDSGVSELSALTSGYHLAYLIGAGLAAIAVGIAVFVLREPAPMAAAQPEREQSSPAPAFESS